MKKIANYFFIMMLFSIRSDILSGSTPAEVKERGWILVNNPALINSPRYVIVEEGMSKSEFKKRIAGALDIDIDVINGLRSEEGLIDLFRDNEELDFDELTGDLFTVAMSR